MLITLWNLDALSEQQSIEASTQAQKGTPWSYVESEAVSSSVQRLTPLDAKPPTASAQTKFNLEPTEVKIWDSFDDDLRMEEMTIGGEDLLNGVAADILFMPLKTHLSSAQPNEQFCADSMSTHFVSPFLHKVVRENEEVVKYGVEFFTEDTHGGFRADWAIGRKAKQARRSQR
mmetsp:Transcript_9854/g.19364  ORF Transcript_9854/g.19364 Transcript_9854/m.19364 type:complete len:174 (-) Transcript_9854:621-1142(-)